MKDLFVSYDISKQLKEKGFKEGCFGYFNNTGDLNYQCTYNSSGLKQIDLHIENTLAPIYQQVVDWFRDKHKILIYVLTDYHDGVLLGYAGHTEVSDGITEYETEDTYYEALDKAIEEALKLI